MNDDDAPQWVILSREVGTRMTVLHSRHESRDEAEDRKDELAWTFNRLKKTRHLYVVSL